MGPKVYSNLYKQKDAVQKYIDKNLDIKYKSNYILSESFSDSLKLQAKEELKQYTEADTKYYNFLIAVEELLDFQEVCYSNKITGYFKNLKEKTEKIYNLKDELDFSDTERKSEQGFIDHILQNIISDYYIMTDVEIKAEEVPDDMEAIYCGKDLVNTVTFDIFTNNMKKFDAGFKNFESALHKNSAEFKNMKQSFKALFEVIYDQKNNENDNYSRKEEIGNAIEALHKATTEYLNAKGIGGKATQLGRDRIEMAMQIERFAAAAGEVFFSDEKKEKNNMLNAVESGDYKAERERRDKENALFDEKKEEKTELFINMLDDNDIDILM